MWTKEKANACFVPPVGSPGLGMLREARPAGRRERRAIRSPLYRQSGQATSDDLVHWLSDPLRILRVRVAGAAVLASGSVLRGRPFFVAVAGRMWYVSSDMAVRSVSLVLTMEDLSMQLAGSYPGRKGGAGVWQRIISLMPEHRVYVEAFCGTAVIAARKRPSPGGTVIIDVDAGVLARASSELAVSWDVAGAAVRSVCGDAVAWLSSDPVVQDPDVLVYCDPPYLRSVRTRMLYDCEFASDVQHRSLLGVLCALPCMVMVSGYWSSLYASMLQGWRCEQFPAMTRGGLREECVWCNFPAGRRLHDVRYVGDGYRQRERIRRLRDRWIARLGRMSVVDRQVVSEALGIVMVGGEGLKCSAP